MRLELRVGKRHAKESKPDKTAVLGMDPKKSHQSKMIIHKQCEVHTSTYAPVTLISILFVAHLP